MTFSGRIGKEVSFCMELERAGDRVTGLYVSEGRSHPTRVRGSWRDNGVLSLDEVMAKGGSHIDARVKGNTLTGTWKDKRSNKTQSLTAGPLVAFTHDKDFSQTYVGSMGKATRIRAKLAKQGLLVSGAYRYSRSKNDLKLNGSVAEDTGRVTLTESDAKGNVTGRFEATFLSPSVLTGSWLSPDGSRVLPVTLEAAEAYPESVSLSLVDAPSAKVVAQESYDQVSALCASTVLFPQFEGLNNAAGQKALNKALRDAAGPAKMDRELCKSASDDTPLVEEVSWSISRTTGKFIGVTISTYSTGAAHPSFSTNCWVANTASGQLFRLASLVRADARTKLGMLVTERLRAEHKVQDLTEIGFYQDPIDLAAQPDLCLSSNGGMTVQMDPYDVAPYVLGAQQVALTPEESRSFVSSPDIDELFPK